MCGRFALKAPPRAVQEHFSLPELPDISPRYNIAPSQSVAVIRQLPDKTYRQLDMLHWGLIPGWAKEMKVGYRMINARAETLPEKPSYRTPFKKRRCLIAADGFYEWQHTGKAKQPYYIQLINGSVFGFAGLWESWNSPNTTIESCTIITTVPNELTADIHDRMPVILHPDTYDTWLQDGYSEDALQQLLVPYPAADMEAYPVGTTVNSPKNDNPLCIKQV